MNTKNYLPKLAGCLVFLLATGSYILSFTGLHDLVVQLNLYPDGLTWLWPVILDGAIITFSLYVVWAIRENVGKKWAMTCVLMVTLASVMFNVIHAPGETLAQVVASFPPLLGFAAFELLMRMLRHYSVGDVEELLGKRVPAAGNMNLQKAVQISSEDDPDVPQKDKLRARRVIVQEMKSKEISLEQIAEKLGTPLRTIKRDLAAIEREKFKSTLDSEMPVGMA